MKRNGYDVPDAKSVPALRELSDLHLQSQIAKYPTFPIEYFPKKKFSDKTANDLTAAIIRAIELSGGYSSRINSAGVYDEKIKAYRTGTTKKGISDIIGCLPNGRFIAVEVKIKTDKLSDVQIKFRDEIIKLGGAYCEARSYEQFAQWFDAIKKENSL